ncbi:plasma membrane localization protein [Linnemannia gamsii]|uniref:Plasma membrane localization protein n=1 Tax=Linnemannia gamsii TaxID=64522 RepID=A0ABQ7JX67_9FUNG|nr:plasma membrane localization protein [Linnemannia gamsii]
MTSASSVAPPTPRPPSTRSRAASISASSLHGANGTLSSSSSPVPPVPVAHANATHSSLIPTRYIKHASLINNCYPTRPDEKGPKSSDLSYLVYYATAKPAKLSKVGNFIERRVARDYRKKRLSDVHCSLEIIKSLLLSSKAHLNIFSKNIVVILDTLLVDISDFDIVRHCQIVFSTFCSAHDGSTLGVDHEFKVLYDRVVARFSFITTLQGDDSNRYRMEGLKAMKGVVSSTALYACDPRSQLNLVLPPILDNLIDTKDGLQVPLEESKEFVAASPRPSSSIQGTVHPEIEVTDEDVTAEALQCLSALFKTPNGGNLKLVLRPTFEYLDEHSIWWPASFGVGIIKAILNALLAQFRYMVVNEILSLMESVDETTSDWILRLQKKATLVSTLEAILVSPLNLIGMPVLEVLNSLLTGLLKSLSRSASLSKEGDSSQQLVLETLIQDGLVRSVGGLATHIYYANQVPHIIAHIVGKLSFKIGASPQPETIDSVPTVEYRKALLRCLTAVIKMNKDHGRREAGFHATDIPTDLLTPCLGLLLDENVGVRAAFAQSLITFLATDDDSHGQGSGMGSPVAAISGDLYFRAATHQTLHTYARLPTATPTDMAAIYGILRALFTHFQDDEFMRVVPVLFSLQDWCLQEPLEISPVEPHLVERKRALATVMVIYFQKAVGSYRMPEPLEYLDNIQNSRESESQWIPIYYENQESLTRTTGHQWETPAEPLTPILTHPLARDHLVTLLTTVSDRFRAGADRFGLAFTPESQSNMTTLQSANQEFGSGLFPPPLLNGGRCPPGHRVDRSIDSRIRVSRLMEDWALPKITPISSSSSVEMGGSIDDASKSPKDSAQVTRDGSFVNGGGYNRSESALSHRAIGVDNLKAALAATPVTSTDALNEVGAIVTVTNGDGRVSTPTLQSFYALSTHAPVSRTKLSLGLGPATGSSVSVASNLAASRPDLADLLNKIQVTVPSTQQHSLVIPPY